MTHEEQLQAVREAVIKANPAILEEGDEIPLREVDSAGEVCAWRIEPRDVRLADVLLAIREKPKTTKIVVDDGGRFWDFNRVRFTDCLWDLEHDCLDQQPSETIDFLHHLLVS